MTRIQLSDAQAVILSAACARVDGAVFPVTASLKGGAAGNVCKSLLKKGLIEEIPATDLDTVWRHDEERGPITLRATPLACSTLGIADAGLAAIGVEPEGGDSAPEGAAEAQSAEAPQSASSEADPAPKARAPRTGTKQAKLIAMLRAEDGATIDEIVAATGWQAQTVRGAMSGALKKRLGLAITSDKDEQRGRVYRLPSA